MATTTGRARPVPKKVRPLWLLRLPLLFFYFFIFLRKFGWNGRSGSISKWAHSKLAIEVFFFDQAQAQASDDIRIEEFISSPLAERGDCSTHTHTHKSALVEQWEKGNLIKVRGEGRESEAAVCQDAYTVLSGLPLLTIRTSLLLMIQLCLHPSLLPPTPTSCF